MLEEEIEPIPDDHPQTSLVVELPPQLDLSACEELSDAFEHLRDTSVALNAAHVKYVGGLAIQLLCAAKCQWAKDGADFAIIDASDAFIQGLCDLGVTTAFIERGLIK
jgi:anti-anti-sigma regulatory factor